MNHIGLHNVKNIFVQHRKLATTIITVDEDGAIFEAIVYGEDQPHCQLVHDALDAAIKASIKIRSAAADISTAQRRAQLVDRLAKEPKHD